MKNNKLKFNKLSDLLNEIDTWINQLQAKKKEILSKIDLDAVKQAFPEDKGKYITDKEGKLFKLISADKEDRKRFISYSTNIDSSNYDLMKKEADSLNLSVSSFLKNNYFMNFINDKNIKNNYIKEYQEIMNTIKDKIEIKEKKSIALALNVNDSKRLEQAAIAAEINPRELIRFLTYEFMYDKLVKHAIRAGFIEEDSNIQYIKCKSTNVLAFGYDKDNSKLYVIFADGAKYRYDNIPNNIYDDFCLAESKGRYVNEVLRVKYKGIKIN